MKLKKIEWKLVGNNWYGKIERLHIFRIEFDGYNFHIKSLFEITHSSKERLEYSNIKIRDSVREAKLFCENEFERIIRSFIEGNNK